MRSEQAVQKVAFSKQGVPANKISSAVAGKDLIRRSPETPNKQPIAPPESVYPTVYCRTDGSSPSPSMRDVGGVLTFQLARVPPFTGRLANLSDTQACLPAISDYFLTNTLKDGFRLGIKANFTQAELLNPIASGAMFSYFCKDGNDGRGEIRTNYRFVDFEGPRAFDVTIPPLRGEYHRYSLALFPPSCADDFKSEINTTAVALGSLNSNLSISNVSNTYRVTPEKSYFYQLQDASAVACASSAQGAAASAISQPQSTFTVQFGQFKKGPSVMADAQGFASYVTSTLALSFVLLTAAKAVFARPSQAQPQTPA